MNTVNGQPVIELITVLNEWMTSLTAWWLNNNEWMNDKWISILNEWMISDNFECINDLFDWINSEYERQWMRKWQMHEKNILTNE